ncbi:phosphatase PAP2 family protein [Nocardioides donggukensis]|uniref:Phosphatase PAP2 family protein n=1 Tax=Nocardioides donggukensis TaxID=2774019 RepID=A0A927K4E0_9ACTN|nr:phosphatase PAP2 family protein [Nocardioides donggukensis]MBD8868835.1 phosphatase PAP2 family protein [Nocardioides donggukensis]
MSIDRAGAVWGARVRLGLLAGAFGIGLVLVYYLTVRTVPGRVFSDTSLRGALLTSSSLRGSVDAALNVVSVASLLGAMAVVAVIALLRLARLQGVAAIGILVGANGSTWLLKNVLLVRPDLGVDEIAPATLNSLPSGHTTAAFSAVAALIFVVPRQLRLVTATVGGGYAALTALATMSAGWHRAGDSIAAFLLVGLWTTLAAAAVVLAGVSADIPDPEPGSAAGAVLRWLGATAAGTFILGITLAGAVVAVEPVRESSVGSATAFAAGALLIAAAAAVALIGMLRALTVMDRAEAAAVTRG